MSFAEDYNDTLEFRNLYKKGTYMETPSPLVENTGKLHLNNNGLKLFIIVPESRTASKEAMVYICKNRKVIQLSLRSFSMRAAMGEEVEKGGEDVLLEIEEHQLLGLYCYQSSLFAITENSITKLDLLTLKKQIIPLPAPLKYVSFFEDYFVYFDIEGHVYQYSKDGHMESLDVSIPSSRVVSISFDGSMVRYLSIQEEGSSTFLEHFIKPKISEVAIKELPGVSNPNAMMKINDTLFIISTSDFKCHVIHLLQDGEWNVRTLKNPCNSRLGRKNPLQKKGLYSFITLGPWTIISDSSCGDLAIISDTHLLILESDPFLPQLPLSRDGKMRELMALSMEVDLTSKQRIHHRQDDPDSSTLSLPPQPTLWILSNEYSFVAFKIINQDLKAMSLCIYDNTVDADIVCDVKEIVQKEAVEEDDQENETVKEISTSAEESTKEPKTVQKKEYQNIFHSKDEFLKNTLIKEFATLSLRMNSLLQLGRQEVALGRDEVNVLADHLNGLSMSSAITESITKITYLYNSLIKAEQKLIESSNEMMEMISLLKSRNILLLEKRIDSVLESIALLKKSTTSTTARKNEILSEINRGMDSISFILKEGSIVGIASHRNRSTKLNVIEERKPMVKVEEFSVSRPPMKQEEPFHPPKKLFSSVPSIPTTKLIPLDGPECTLVFDDRVKKTISPNVKEIKVIKEVTVKSEIDSTPPIIVVDKPDSVVIKVEEDKNEKSSFDFGDFSPSLSSTPKKVEQTFALKAAKYSISSSSLSSLVSASVVLPPVVKNTETNVQEKIVEVESLKPNKEQEEQENRKEEEDMSMDTVDGKNTPSPVSSSKSSTTFLSAPTTKDTNTNPFASFSVPKLQSTTAPPIPSFGTSASFGYFGASSVTANASFGTPTSTTSFTKAFNTVPSAFGPPPNAFGGGPSLPQQQKSPVFGSSGFGQSIQSVSPFGVPVAAPIKSTGVFGSTSVSPSPSQPSSFSGFASFNNQNNANNIFGAGGGGSFGQTTKKEEEQKKKEGGKLSFTEFRM